MTYGQPSPWTDERIELLKKLWSEGLSSRKIGAELGLNRNTVIGKAARLGLQKRERPAPAETPKPIRNGAAVMSAVRSAAQRKAEGNPVKPADHPTQVRAVKRAKQSKPVSIWDAKEGQCRWPNDGSVCDGTFRFCGAPAPDWPYSCYCRSHQRLAWTKWRAEAA